MIPIIDLGSYLAGHPGATAVTAAELGRALQDVGFFVIVNHGIPQPRLGASTRSPWAPSSPCG